MRVHAIQHVPFEDLARIQVWAERKGYPISRTHLFDGGKLPAMTEFDWLVVLGGPMNVYEERKYPWLIQEKRFIEKAIDQGKVILGICLGAQLLADVLGAKVSGNSYKEIGWHPVKLTKEAEDSTVFHGLPHEFTPFHWHGDTFDLPQGAVRIAQSEGCLNQAFEYHERVIGLQFHLESTRASIKRLIENCGDEIEEGKYVQLSNQMLSQGHFLSELEFLMTQFLNNMERKPTFA